MPNFLNLLCCVWVVKPVHDHQEHRDRPQDTVTCSTLIPHLNVTSSFIHASQYYDNGGYTYLIQRNCVWTRYVNISSLADSQFLGNWSRDLLRTKPGPFYLFISLLLFILEFTKVFSLAKAQHQLVLLPQTLDTKCNIYDIHLIQSCNTSWECIWSLHTKFISISLSTSLNLNSAAV